MDWSGDTYREPQLGDVTIEKGSERAYEVVGIEEHRDSPRVWWLVLERISLVDALGRTGRCWEHVRYRRRS